MSTQYIIKFETNGTETDGVVELKRNKSNIPIITVRTHSDKSNESNQTLLYKFMTNDFAKATFEDTERKCILCCKKANSNIFTNTFTIVFDSSSSSAYSEFKKTYNEFVNSKYETEYYPSERVMYVGEVLYKKEANDIITERIPNGTGVLYYDLPDQMIKYVGEFENGMYDGAGIFYTTDGKISIQANNISAGIPTQKAKISINFKTKQETLEINMNEVWDKFMLSSKDLKKKLVLTDTFVNEVSYLYWNYTDLEEHTLCEKSTDDKFVALWETLREYQTRTDEKDALFAKELKAYLVLSTLVIIFTNILSIYLF